MTGAAFSNKTLGLGGAIIISAWITHKDKGALSVLSVQSNDLHADGGKALAKGLKGNTVITELDISSNYLGLDFDYEPDMSGVIALADAIPDMRAMTSLNLALNYLRAAGAKVIAEAIKVITCAIGAIFIFI
jgi:hypothetical protein